MRSFRYEPPGDFKDALKAFKEAFMRWHATVPPDPNGVQNWFAGEMLRNTHGHDAARAMGEVWRGRDLRLRRELRQPARGPCNITGSDCSSRHRGRRGS